MKSLDFAESYCYCLTYTSASSVLLCMLGDLTKEIGAVDRSCM